MVKILWFVFIVVNRVFVLIFLGIMCIIGIYVWFLLNKDSEFFLIEMKLMVYCLIWLLFIYNW